MRSAPPVVFPAGRFRWGPGGAVLAGALCAIALGLWQSAVQAPLQTSLLIWSVWVGAAVLSALLGRREFAVPKGALNWDGAEWLWQAEALPDRPVRLSVLLDGGAFLLVSVREEAGAQGGVDTRFYGCLSRSHAPEQWHGLRCAVYCRMPSEEVGAGHRQSP